jgi:hypothetical protein
MTPGTLTTIHTTIATLSVGTGIVLFTEDTQRLICITMNRKAAVAGGIEAIAARAIDTGDAEEALEHIVNLAAELREELLNLASLAGQIVAARAA